LSLPRASKPQNTNPDFKAEEEHHRRNIGNVIFRSPFTQRGDGIILIAAPHQRARGALDATKPSGDAGTLDAISFPFFSTSSVA
jgi:hypothetical protein